MKLFSAFGLVVVFVLLAVMMPRVFDGLEGTLHQFFTLAQDALLTIQHLLVSISSNT